MSVQKLNPANIKILLRLLDCVNPVPNMQYTVLRSFWKNRLFPMLFSELFLTMDDPFRTSPRNVRVLLSLRDDADYAGLFHAPGGMIAAREEIRSAVARIVQKEIGVGVTESWTVCHLNNRNHQRSSGYSPVLICRLDREPDLQSGNMMFAPLGALPERVLPYHRELAKRVIDWLSVMQSFSAEQRKRILEVTDIFEYPYEE